MFTFCGLIGALVVYLRSGNDPFVRANARAALNMQITWTIVAIVGLVAYVGFIYANYVGEPIVDQVRRSPVSDVAAYRILLGGFGAIVALMIAIAVMNVIGARAAHLGRVYRYPIAYPFLRG